MARLPALLLLVLALVCAACGSDDEEPAAAPTPEPTEAPPSQAEEAGCEEVAQPDPKGAPSLEKPSFELDADKTYVATVLTSCGEFEITLDSDAAPGTGGSFVTLAKDGFYDGLTFHRIASGFVIQGGDPVGDGTGGPGYSVVEKPPEDLVYKKGVVAMAKTQVEEPGTSGSQFFVVTAEDAGLPPEYALLGEVTKGMEVVDRIAAVEHDENDRPIAPVVIRQITIAES